MDFQRVCFFVYYKHKFAEELNNILNTTIDSKFLIDISKHVVNIIWETELHKCTECGHKTAQIYHKGNRGQEGSVIISYGNLEGPLLGLAYRRICSKCDTSFSYGYFESNEKKEWTMKDNSEYFQLSRSTIFKKDLLQECLLFYLEDGVSIESYTHKYNERHKLQIATINNIMEIQNQKIGSRQTAELNHQRLRSAFFLYFLEKSLHEQLGESLTISKQEMAQIKEQKLSNTNDNNNTKNIDISTDDIFNFIVTKKGYQIQIQNNNWLKYVPVKDKVPYPGSFIIVGDCNVKRNRLKCLFPTEFLVHLSEMQEIEKLNVNHCYCDESPIKANKHKKLHLLCKTHTEYLITQGVNEDTINDFVTYMDLITRLKNVNPNSISYKTVTQQLKQFDTRKESFENMRYKILGINVRRSERQLTNDSKNRIQQLVNIIQGEQEDDSYFEELAGCRKGKNATRPKTGWTGGVCNFMTSSGFILFSKELVARETPTQVIFDTMEFFTSSSAAIQFYERAEAFSMFLFFVHFGSHFGNLKTQF